MRMNQKMAVECVCQADRHGKCVCVWRGGGCLITIEIKRSKGLKNSIFPGMAKLLMPEVDGVGDSMKCARWLEAEWV
jgi:hypothetical protein